MKNIIRFTGFVLALFVATTMSAQSNWAPAGSKGTPATDTGTPTAAQGKEFISFSDNATISIFKGTISYQVYIKKLPELPWQLVQTANNVSTPNIAISMPSSYQLKIVVVAPTTSYYTVTFAN